MPQVPLIRTVASTREFAHACISAWRHIYNGHDPSKLAVGVLYAQWMVETGGKAFWNWNIGNVKVTPGQVAAGVDYVDLPGTWEIINGQRVVLAEGDPGRRFRAYASLDDGMTEHMAFLRNKRYAPSWPFVEAGDPVGFARALKAQGYYTASAEDYARIMTAAHKQWMASDAFDSALLALAEVPPDTEPEDSEPPSVVLTSPIVHSLRIAGLPGVGDDEPESQA